MTDPKQIVRATDEHAAERPLPAGAGIAFRSDSDRPAASPHSHKFRAVTATLVGLAMGAVIIAVALLAGDNGSAPSAPWSSWTPSDSGTLAEREIADHLAPLYRISAVDQLAVVTVVNTSNSSSAGATSGTASPSTGIQVAVRPDSSSSAVSVLNGNTVAYNLCGIGGSDCSIGVGQPSSDRLLLLRREALELALYTFKYVGGVNNVVAILPPGHTVATSTLTAKPPSSTSSATNNKPLNIALLFLRDELQPWIAQPVVNTLPEQFPPAVDQMRTAPEAGLVEQITARGLFSQHLVTAQDGSTLIVLDPLPPQ
jgi:hypothetical protein